MPISKDSMIFQFMLKEYEKLYSHLDIEYQAAERSINFYFVLIGALISVNSLINNTVNRISIFQLSGLQYLFLLILCILGSLIYFKVIEHRLLIITFVKSLNLNRKWFVENSEDKSIENFLFFKTGTESPLFYRKYRHFYWEAAGLALINSLFISLLFINLFKRCFHLFSEKASLYNIVYAILLSLIIAGLHLRYYKLRGLKEEKALKRRFAN